MKKIVSGMLLALASCSLLAACDYEQYRNRGYTHDPNCTCTCSCCEEARNGHKTTKGGSTTKDIDDIIEYLDLNELNNYSANTYITVLSMNTELKEAFEASYPEFKARINSYTSLLNDGTRILWIYRNPDLDYFDYYAAAKVAIQNNLIDLFDYDYSIPLYELINEDYIVDLESEGLDFSKQFYYAREAVRNKSGHQVGSAWTVNPGVVSYNDDIAKDIYGNNVSISTMKNKFYDFDTTGIDALTKGYSTFVSPSELFRMYMCQVNNTISDNTFTLDNRLFDYLIDARRYCDSGFFTGIGYEYYTWGYEWCNNFKKALYHYSCPWFAEYSLDEYTGHGYDESYTSFKMFNPGSSYSSYWGGNWVSATTRINRDETIKHYALDIISKLTTDKDSLLAKKSYKLCPNNIDALNVLASSSYEFDDSYSFYKYYGGQNVYQVYKEALNDFNHFNPGGYVYENIMENEFQMSFRKYFQYDSATSCINEFSNMLLSHRNLDLYYDDNYVDIGETFEYI